MLLSKSPAALLSSCSGLPSLSSLPWPSCRHRHPPAQPHHHQRQRQHHRARHYAQQAPGSHGHESDASWPSPSPPHTTPTPYDILHVRRGDVYTKQRFYALVKLYHPDRCGPSSPVAHLPHGVRLERYRLLVAAHAILSDDAKRRAYDACGHGWAGHHQTPSHAPHEWPPATRQWPPGHDPMNNATWEDWERWYRREYDHQQQEDPRALYMSNFAFISLVCTLVSFGLVVQGTRANSLSSSVMEHRDKIHKEASMELAHTKRGTIASDRNDRIRTFLENREAAITGEVSVQQLLPPSENCAPDTVSKR